MIRRGGEFRRVVDLARRIMRPAALLGFAALVAACQAPLDLSGVEATRKQPIRRTDVFQAVVDAPDGTLLAGNDGLMVLKPADGSAMQRQILTQPDHFPPVLIAMTRCPDGRVFALGSDKSLWTRTGKDHWTAGKVPTDEAVLTLTCSPAGTLWIGAGFATLLHSTDGGRNWESTSFDDDLQFTEVHFPSAQTGFALGEFGTVMRTRDGGKSWQRAGSPSEEFYPLSAWFRDDLHGWAGSLDGAIYATADGGDSWVHEASGTRAPIYGLTGDAQNVYAVGNFGVFLVRRDGHWQPGPHSGTRGFLRAFSRAADGTLTFAGQSFAGRYQPQTGTVSAIGGGR